MDKEALLHVIAADGRMALAISGQIAAIIARRMEHASSRYQNVSDLYRSGAARIEHDLLGEREVPIRAYYGIQTLRAVENFDISGILLNMYPLIITGFAMVKQAAARANHDVAILSDDVFHAIDQACDEICHGMLHNHFIVDMIQGGAGTSINMNANEVIANRALEILDEPKGAYHRCHPNNHVNLSQSTNDAYPTAVKVALLRGNQHLIAVLETLISALDEKSHAFGDVVKMGRTQLQDAVPMTLGQSFGAFASTLRNEVKRLRDNADLFLEVNMGGTAIGTGINADPDYSRRVVRHLREITGFEITLAKDLIEATHDTGAFVMYSSALKRLAVKLSKISNDLRLLSSGPRAGINEIDLPAMQPGSSIMPGKVNPVIPEVVNQIAFKVIGNDLTITMAAEAGQLELNVMEPVIVECLFESIEMLKNGMTAVTERCIRGITANRDVCREYVTNSIGLVTALNPHLGYEVCSALAREALKTGCGVAELVIEKGFLSQTELDEILNPENMIR
jgi:aspartate ammonia-lyase